MNTREHGLSTHDLENNNRSEAEVIRNRIYTIRARGPILNKANVKVIIGVSATIEEFQFDDAETLSEPFLISLEDRSLRTVGFNVVTIKSFRSNKYLVSRLQTRLNGDFDSGDGNYFNYLRFGIVSVLAWKLDNNRVFGVGAAFNHIYGKASILPVVLYYNSFHPKWGLEANLPANARLRYSPDPKHFFYAGAEVNGANYRLAPTQMSVPYFLEKSELNLGCSLEREIHDWVWVGIKFGYRANLSLNISLSQQLNYSTDKRLLETNVDSTLYYGLSIFLVAPKKMHDR